MSSPRWPFLLLVLCFAVPACGSAGAPVSGEATNLTDPDTTPSITATILDRASTTTAGATMGPLLVDTRWVRLDVGALVDERGRTLVDVGEAALGGSMVERDIDGTVVYATLEGLFQIEPGDAEPTKLFDGEVFGLTRSESGVVLADTALGTWDPTSGAYVDLPLAEDVPSRMAANGLSVEMLPGSYELDAEGWIRRVERPDGIRLLDDNGDQTAIWELGGPGAPFVDLVDFDGRFIVAARGPEEPALPDWDHFVIDLHTGSVEVFGATPGTIALATADDPAVPSSLQIPNIDVCPTWSETMAKQPDASLPETVADSHRLVLLATARCDTWFLEQSIGWDDRAGWVALERSLLGPPTVGAGSWTWQLDPAATVTIDQQGEIEIEVDGDGAPELHIVRDENDLVLTGRVDSQTAARLIDVAALTAERHDLELTSSLSEGAELDNRRREAIEEFLGTSMGFSGDGIVALEARLAADSFRVWAVRQDELPVVIGELSADAFATAGIEPEEQVDRPGVSDAESEIVDDLLAFARGDREAAVDIPWADEVALAFGPTLAEVVAIEDLLEPSTWTVDVGPLRGTDGPISLLPSADATWSTPTAGPHPHCASPPVAAPPLLAGLRRISIQTTGFDSCLPWRTLDVFIDTDGRVAGVSTDVWEP